ncbi:MAG: DUF4405 domain-containing protein [Gemmatimonadaceae bacterium]|nr:DUF4405 domain-containing protein [Gemmatimonadaceae bacterium]
MSPAKPFRWKAFVSLYIVFSFLVLALSGLVLYVAPPGRIANWSIWRLVLLSKAQWQAVHTIFAFIFIVAASFHLYFNWKVLLAYLRSKLHEGLHMKREVGAASAAGVLLLALTIGGVPPFSSVMEAGDDIKNAWAAPSSEPPIPHAEDLTVQKLAETAKVPVEQARQNLLQHGVAVDRSDMTVKEIAASNKISPEQVYQRMYADSARPVVAQGQGGGWGRRTVQDICTQYGVSSVTAIDRLKVAGFTAAVSTTLKDLALGSGKTPSDIAQIIVGPDATIATPDVHRPAATAPPPSP